MRASWDIRERLADHFAADFGVFHVHSISDGYGRSDKTACGKDRYDPGNSLCVWGTGRGAWTMDSRICERFGGSEDRLGQFTRFFRDRAGGIAEFEATKQLIESQ